MSGHGDVAAPAGDGDRANPRVGLTVFLLGVATAALYAFVIYPRQNTIEAVIDLNGFGRLGRHIADGQGFSLGSGPTLRRAPLYPAFVALMVGIFGNQGTPAHVFRPVLAAQCVMLGLTCVVSWTIGCKLFGPRAGLLAGILCAIVPQCLRYVSMTEVETTMGLLIALMALTGLNLSRKPSYGNAALFGVVCAAAALTKAVAMLYPFVFVLTIAASAALRRRSAADDAKTGPTLPFAALAAAIGVFVLCLLPWSIRNRIVSGGHFSGISSNGSGEFLRGYVNAQPKFFLLKQDFGGTDPTNVQWDVEANLYEDALLSRHGMSFFSFGPHGELLPMEARVDLELRKEAIENAEMKRRVSHEPAGFVRKFVVQIFMYWYIVETRKKSLFVGAIAFCALALAIFGWAKARRNGIDATPVVCVVLYFNLLYAAILAFARYSMPVFPTLLVLTAFGFTQLWGDRRNETSRQSDKGA